MREARVGELVAAVARQALADFGVARVALADDGSPEAGLAARLLEALGPDALLRAGADGPGMEPLLHSLRGIGAGERAAREAAGLRARLAPDALAAAPENKTVLLLCGVLPPEPFFPLGDLYAGDVAELCGGWSAPEEIRALADSAGGIGRLDGALRAWLDRRDPSALDRLPAGVAEEVRRRFARGRPSRFAVRLVPKVGYRTLGVDLFE